MTRKASFIARAGEFVAVLGAARNVAAAVDAHRKPNGRDLDRLGIDAAAFNTIRF
ncbi:hypothetical protein [Devosia sp.]|uniref:hypothetical protein n=1 Tax=Devosia sp. TaxID=1871048 RepID=UPI002EE0D9BB